MPLINFSGLASGIDSEALIEATSDAARAQRVTPSETRITELENESTALEEYKTLLTDLRSITQGFNTLNGGAVSHSAKSSDEATLTATASNTAEEGVYTITVSQVAKNATYSFNNVFTGSNALLLDGPASNIDVTIGGVLDVSISATATTTLDEFVSEFNSKTTEAVASVVQIDTNDYRIVITTSSTGSPGVLAVTADGGTWLGDGTSASTIDQAVAANFTMSGVAGTIVRDSNVINDLVSGVTFDLKGTSVTPVTIKIETDVTTTTASVSEFVNKFNEIVDFLVENNLVEREGSGKSVTNVFGPLSSTRVDDNSLQALRNNLVGAAYSLGGECKNICRPRY